MFVWSIVKDELFDIVLDLNGYRLYFALIMDLNVVLLHMVEFHKKTIFFPFVWLGLDTVLL